MGFFKIDAISIGKALFSLFKLIVDLIKRGKGNNREIRKLIEKIELDEKDKNKLYYLISNKSFRIFLDEMTALLDLEKMKAIEVEQPSHASFEIDRSERRFFIVNPEDEETVEFDEKIVTITYLSPEKNRWQFKSGSSEFWATVMDQSFVAMMQNKKMDEIKYDKFRATVKTKRIIKAKTKRVKVIREIDNFVPMKSGFGLEYGGLPSD